MANSTDKLTKLQELVTQIRNSKHSSFYMQIWGDKNNEADLYKLPVCTVANFIKTPPFKRRYFTGKGVTKIVKRYETPFLVERTLADLFEEDYGNISCRKPLVLFKDPREAIEKSLWFYEHNILPLIGESNNLPVVVHSAQQYRIDALVTEVDMIADFMFLYKKESKTLENIKSVTLIGSDFNDDVLSLLSEINNVKFILALPEAGSIAVSCDEKLNDGELVFHETKNSIIETGEETIVSKVMLMPTPIIRYKTDLHLTLSVSKPCLCGKKGFYIV